MKSADRLSKVGNCKEMCISIPCSQDFMRSYNQSPRDDPFLFLANSKSRTPKLRPVCPSRNSSGFSKLFSPTHSVGQTPDHSLCSKPDQLNKLHIQHKRSLTHKEKNDIEKQRAYKGLATMRDVKIRRLSKHAIREIASPRELAKTTIQKGSVIESEYVRATTPSFKNAEVEGSYERLTTLDMFIPQRKSVNHAGEPSISMTKSLFGQKMRLSRNKAISCVTEDEKYKHLCELEDISFGN